MVKDLLEGWDAEWRSEGLIRRREISCLSAAAIIGFCGGLQREEAFMNSLKGMLKFWEETRNKKEILHIMVTLKGQLKGKTGEKWHMLTLVDTMKS